MSISDKRIIVFVSAVGLVGVAVAVSFLFSQLSSKYPFSDIVLAENTSISSEWQEIDVTDRIMLKGDDRFVAVKLQEPFIGDFEKKGIQGPDGQIFHPEIIIVDSDGIEYALTYRGFLGRMKPIYGNLSQLPPDKVYRTMRIRSEIPFQASEITWTYYSALEMP